MRGSFFLIIKDINIDKILCDIAWDKIGVRLRTRWSLLELGGWRRRRRWERSCIIVEVSDLDILLPANGQLIVESADEVALGPECFNIRCEL